ncbi:MAG: glycosyltransferase family 4 protein [Lachnospiraceae bacterium]|nr:glycosyltransferase family 4 protein [Lachnospiraceae bacterium]
MRVLWVCNVIPTAFAREFGMKVNWGGGWIDGIFERTKREPDLKSATGEERLIELGVCMPLSAKYAELTTQLDGVTFYGFKENMDAAERYDPQLEVRFKKILDDFSPDIVHIFGTEYPHTLAMTRAFEKPKKTLIGVQGVCSEIAKVYMADLPYVVQHAKTFRDRYRRDSLKEQQEKFRLRAQMEKEALEKTGHITGRTMFDRRATARINPDAVYHPMNETLRDTFYEGEWDIDRVRKHSIFVSQGNYPLKGLHFMLQAMPLILEKYPDAHLYVGGDSLIGNVGGAFRERSKYPLALRITAYGLYLKRLIRQGHLEGHVTMLGRLNAEQMKEQYLKSHVYVCPSVLENSPNSLGEAMLLGMPAIAAKVGGIPDLLTDGEEGILFPSGRYGELAEGVKAVFDERDLAGLLGRGARRRAMITHNPDTNFARLLEIYRSMALQ